VPPGTGGRLADFQSEFEIENQIWLPSFALNQVMVSAWITISTAMSGFGDNLLNRDGVDGDIPPDGICPELVRISSDSLGKPEIREAALPNYCKWY
jgi:hypothetical protein